MPVTPHATKQDFERTFAGFYYPISKSAILNMGRDKGGTDREVARILQLLPERRYNSVDEVKEAVRAVYLSRGVVQDDLPI